MLRRWIYVYANTADFKYLGVQVCREHSVNNIFILHTFVATSYGLEGKAAFLWLAEILVAS